MRVTKRDLLYTIEAAIAFQQKPFKLCTVDQAQRIRNYFPGFIATAGYGHPVFVIAKGEFGMDGSYRYKLDSRKRR